MKYDTASFKERLAEVNPNVTVLGEYVGSRVSISCRCNVCGGNIHTRPDRLLKGSRCRHCAAVKYDTKSFKEKMSSVNPNITILGEYVNSDTHIECVCNICGTTWSPTAHSLLSGCGCNNCATQRRRTARLKYDRDSFINKIKEANPYIDVLGEYKNMRTHIHCKCILCGKEWDPVPSSLLHGRGCNNCSKLKYDTRSFIHIMKSINRNIIILGEYVKADEGILCRCNICGNEWNPLPRVLLVGGGCPKCYHTQTSFAEQFVYESLKQVFGESEVYNRNRGAIGKELDIYIPKANFAVELCGWHWHKKKIKSDNDKVKLCKRYGINTLFVYDTCPESSIDIDSDYIVYQKRLDKDPDKKELKELVARIVERPELSNIKRSSQVNELNWNQIIERSYANSRRTTTEQFKERLSKINQNITVLGDYKQSEVGILCRCNICGNEWNPKPHQLLRGHGCPECANLRKHKYTEQSFKDKLMIKNPNIALIGPFVSVNKRVVVQCRVCGHQWSPIASEIIKGSGCSSCDRRKKSKYTTETFRDTISKINPYICVDGEYVNNKTGVHCKCKICGKEWDPVPSSLLRGSGCSSCVRKVKRIAVNK